MTMKNGQNVFWNASANIAMPPTQVQQRQQLLGGHQAVGDLAAEVQPEDARDRLRREDPADLAAGEPEHVAEIERQQRQPRSPDQVLEEHHHGEARRGGGHDWRCTIVHPMAGRLGVGFIGSGFMTRFHIRSWEAVRDADIRGIYSPTRANAEDAAALVRSLRVGDAKAFGSIEAMVADESIDCIWLCGPNFARVENMERIVAAIKQGAKLKAIACEKPLARNAAEAARMVELVEEAGVLHGYLENQLFAPSLERGKQIVWARGAAAAGRPYLARAAEEHGGPHMPWFWQGDLQGGGVLNDMMCHSLEVGRYLLTKPGAPRDSIRPVKVSAQIASLKWSRPDYVDAASRHDDRQGRLRPASRRGFRARQRHLRRRSRTRR